MSVGGANQDFNQSTGVNLGEAAPFVRQALGIAEQGLPQLQQLLGGNLVAGFTPEQQQYFAQARDVAGGGGGFIPTAQDALLGAAGGTDISTFLPSSAFSSLEQLSQANPFSSLPPEVAQNLTDVAGGRFAFGGPGFQQSVDAAIEAALPGVSSAFGRTAGGLSGGVARQELGRFGVVEALRQQAGERNRALQAAGLLGDIGRGERETRLRAAGTLAGEGSRERDRALNAARQLPGIGMAGADILRDVGGQRQGLEQLMLTAPIDAQLQLLQAALGSIGAASPLFGQDTSGSQSGFKWGIDVPGLSEANSSAHTAGVK